MYKELYVNIITAAAALLAAYAFGNLLLPVLRRLRLIRDGEEKLFPENRYVLSGGAALCIGTVLSSALGLILLRFFSDSFDFDGRTDPIFFISEFLIIISAAAGFYSDILAASGKKGGFSGRAALFTEIFICAVFLTSKYYLYNNTKIYTPFKNEITLGGIYYPVMLIIMTAVWKCTEYSAKSAGEAPAVLSAYFLGAMALFSHIRSDETALLCASLAGASMGMLMLNSPRLILAEGDSGKFFFGASAAVICAVSENTIFTVFMLLPVFTGAIAGLLRKHGLIKTKEKTVTPSSRAERTLILFLAGMICAVLSLTIFFVTVKR